MTDARRAQPPRRWIAPSGLCECGCGGKTTISPVTHRARDIYAGYPIRFIHGHHARLNSGADCSNWKGGRTHTSNGYVSILVSPKKYRAEHLLIWEAAHGAIPTGHQVHHINAIKTDNRLENLICLSRSAHKHIHQHTEGAHHEHISDKKLIAAYRRLWRKLKHPPTTTECYADPDTPAWTTYHKRFGSIVKVRQLASR